MTTAIVKYNAGNIRSVKNAFDRLGIETVLTDDPKKLISAERVIFPGVGEASSAMRYLRERGLDRVIAGLTQPVLGICLGMQLLCEQSDENATQCLGVFPHEVRRMTAGVVKVPHMGWNRIHGLRSPIFEGIAEIEHMYFVHSYYVEDSGDAIARSDHGATFTAALAYRNFYAVQFHPEKSGPVGARILENFLKIRI